MTVKSCILAQFRPENNYINIFPAKIKKQMLIIILNKYYYTEL